MRVHVLVVCDQLDELARTAGALDAQRLAYSDFAVGYAYPVADPAGSGRLEDLASKRPNCSLVRCGEGGWSSAVEGLLADTEAAYLLVLRAGEMIFPEALERLVDLAEKGHDVVVGRRVGSPVWGATELRGPVAAVLVSTARARTSSVPTHGAVETVEAWLDGWHDTLLAAADSPVALEDYPVLAPSAGSTQGFVTVQQASAGWEGGTLLLGATIPTWDGPEPAFAVRGPGEIEFSVPTQSERSEESVRLTGRLDPATAALGGALGDGSWTVGVVTSAPGHATWTPLPHGGSLSALIGGRPVASTLRKQHLELQVGKVRRRYFKTDPAEAVITESVDGIELVLPLHDVHVAGTGVVHGSAFLGRLRIPATIRVDASRVSLHVWLSGLAGAYPLAVDFGHVKPVPLGMTLEVDGVGSMRMVATRRAAPGAAPSTPVDSPDTLLGRVRRVLPAPVANGLRRVPALRKWYAEHSG